MQVIAINGLIGAGKSSIAKMLIERHGFVLAKFAKPLKDMLRTFYRMCGLDEETIERKIEGDLKEVPCPYLNGHSPRYGMQTLGTEWGCELIGDEVWVKPAIEQIKRTGAQRIVIDDCRYEVEAEAIREHLDATIWRVVRPGQKPSGHRSELEQSAVEPDVTIVNNGTLADLLVEVEDVLVNHGVLVWN